jgi:hypothetical protein
MPLYFVSQSGGSVAAQGLVLGLSTVTSGGSYSVLSTDVVVNVKKTIGSATTINLPSSPVNGRMIIVKDGKGDAATNNITVTPASGNVDGSATFVINNNRQSNIFIYDSTAGEWTVN